MKNDVYRSYLNSPFRSIKHSTYFKSYEHFFEKYRGKEFTFVEIGVLGGGSLFMWRDYFGHKARIVGIDVNPNAKKWEREGFEIYIGSQSDKDFWKEVKKEIGNIDVVLDDGGHTYEQQIITVESLLDSMNDGGIIVVEDTHTSYMYGFGPKKFSFIKYVKNKIDQINFRFAFKDLKQKEERRIWSIEIVESMIAFRIDKVASHEVSIPTDNKGEDDTSEDLRYGDVKSIHYLKKLSKKLAFLKNLSFLRNIFYKVLYFLSSKKFNAKEYFKK